MRSLEDIDIHLWSMDEAIILANKYGFKDAKKLHYGIINAFHQYGIKETSIKDQRDLLEALRDHANSVYETINKLSHAEMSHLENIHGNDIDEFIGDASDINNQLYHLANHTLAIIKNKKDKRTKDPLWSFVLTLADLWFTETGKRPTCNHHTSYGYVGDFYDFTVECMKLDTFLQNSVNSAGATIQNVIKLWRKSNPK